MCGRRCVNVLLYGFTAKRKSQTWWRRYLVGCWVDFDTLRTFQRLPKSTIINIMVRDWEKGELSFERSFGGRVQQYFRFGLV